MKILHTSDIHLKKFEDERWDTLIKLLKIGKEKKVEIFAISGDLFDKEYIAEDLRPNLRKIFSNNGFNILLLPGNHDSESYKSGLYYGENVTVLNELTDPFNYKNISVWGLPFEPIGEKQVLEKLHSIKNEMKPDKTNILMYHGELLDAFFSRKDFGEEGEERYMPVKLSYFRDLNLNYVLAGHFHSRFEVWQIDENKFFIYPSSPISIKKNELGIRKVNIFEVGEPPQEYPLDTPHFEQISIEFNPLEDSDPLEIVKKSLVNIHPQAQVCLEVKGYINSQALGINERGLVEQIDEVVSDHCYEVDYQFKDISVILEDELFKKFMKKLHLSDFNDDVKDYMKDLVIKSMMGIKK